MRSSKPITVMLDEQQELVDCRLESGAYRSASDVVKAALIALDRVENAELRDKLQEAIDDPAPDIASEDVFAELRAYHQAKVKSGLQGRFPSCRKG
ncbi:type II toxin-antitoxin system ParD family antitoxin [Rhizobium sp. RU36D]|uniref:ribbon-helix-helix domain-containing protein n=1 Tax=Rhizobium sp. RU36D TaxID=1907415 RepID=UPI0009D79F1B|nr:type II toxin-antitoxin system ParD family antitoxin [Rhizobium sp. RU36D]SMC47201.1 putative addiction module antidote protein, CC2985 family [Rhizobium sp. RU36D]